MIKLQYFFTSFFILLCFACTNLLAQNVQLITKGFDGSIANGDSVFPAVSGNGRYVCFHSSASNLVADDLAPSHQDVFVWDKRLNQMSRISVNSAGVQGNGRSLYCTISRSGRFVAFTTEATNLVANDLDSERDVILVDRKRGTQELISVSTSGVGGNSFSSPSFISDNGRYIFFSSDASDLVENDLNGVRDVFVRDRKRQKTQLVSLGVNNQQGDGDSFLEGMYAVSQDNRFVLFQSTSSNLDASATPAGVSQAYVRDLKRKRTTLVTRDKANTPLVSAAGRAMMSRDARKIVYTTIQSLDALDNNDDYDSYLRSRKQNNLKLVSVNAEGELALGGYAVPRGFTQAGRYLLLRSTATNLVPTSSAADFSQVLVKDLKRKQYFHVSVSASGEAANQECYSAGISLNGRAVTFESQATNLVSENTGGFYNIFVKTLRVPKDILPK